MENYFKCLNENDKLDYRKKLTLESGETLPDPYSLRNDWMKILMLFLKFHGKMWCITSIETPSIYTNEKLKAYKLLEAYNSFVCGHVQKCYYHPIC